MSNQEKIDIYLDIVNSLTERMKYLANKQDYEGASLLRDTRNSLRNKVNNLMTEQILLEVLL